MEPQCAAALKYEELRRRYQLEVQQEINLCRRLMEEQQHQLLSESEYRNNLQRIHDINELQAQQEQQQSLGHLFSRNPNLLQQYQQQREQQQQSHRENTIISYLRDEFLSQQRQQQQMQQLQQLQQLSHDSHQQEQEELLAAIRACENLGRVPPAELVSLVSSLRPSVIVARQHPSASLDSPIRSDVPPALDSSHAYVEHFLDNSSRQLADYIPGLKDYANRQTEVISTGERREEVELDGNDVSRAAQDQSKLPQTQTNEVSLQQPKISFPSYGTKSELSNMIEIGDNDQVSEVSIQQPKSDHIVEKNANVELKKKSTKIKNGQCVVARGSKGKKSSITAGKIGKKARVSNRRRTDGNKLSIHESTAIGFFGNTELNEDDDQSQKNQGALANEANKHKFGTAANIVLNFQRCSVSENEVQMVKTWSDNSRNGTSSNSVILPEDITFFSQGMKFNLPLLPIEPELNELQTADMSLTNSEHSVVDVISDNTTMGIRTSLKSPLFPSVNNRSEITQKMILRPIRPGKDSWWPPNNIIRKERQRHFNTEDDEDTYVEDDVEDLERLESVTKAGVKAVEQRLATSNEPGVLEKLPHCKLYDDYCVENAQNEFTPMFCCQTTEMFPFDIMVCCSVCSTWRHAQCGGHYKHYTAQCVDLSSKLFVPLCDQCCIEKHLIESNPSGEKRIERQRVDHLRRCNATNAVMRQFAFAKHSGQCKWPLGSVPISQFADHIRNVQARHEKAEKQWKDMTARLGNDNPSERQRVRTKELERLLVCIKDAGKSVNEKKLCSSCYHFSLCSVRGSNGST